MSEQGSFLVNVWRNLIGPIESLRDYWSLFGGLEALIGSPYAWASFLITTFLWRFKGKMTWMEPTFSILPNLLGFTVAAYAILVAFGNDDFKRIILAYPKKSKHSFFMTLNGTFCHFIITQSTTLVYAVLFKALGLNAIYYQAVGMFLLIYSILLSIAVALAMLTIARTYQTITIDRISKEGDPMAEVRDILKAIRDRISHARGTSGAPDCNKADHGGSEPHVG